MGLDALYVDDPHINEHDEELRQIVSGFVPNRGYMKVMPERIRIYRGLAFVDEVVIAAAKAHNSAASLMFLDDRFCRSLLTYGAAKEALSFLSKQEKKSPIDSLLETQLLDAVQEMADEVKLYGALRIFRERKAKDAHPYPVANPSYVSNLAYGLLQCAVDIESATDIKDLLSDREAFMQQITSEDLKNLSMSEAAKKVPKLKKALAHMRRYNANNKDADSSIQDAADHIRDALRIADPVYVAGQIELRTGISLMNPGAKRKVVRRV